MHEWFTLKIKQGAARAFVIAMPQGRPSFAFVLIDLPSDHEIEGGLITESQMINAMLHNRALGSRTKSFRVTSKSGFEKISRPYRELGFVHLATHGSARGISLIGSKINWHNVADKLKSVAPLLPPGKKRVLCLSCCYSCDGYKAMKSSLKGYFTGTYYFHEEVIEFATAMTVWSMFYRKKSISRPAAKIVDSINKFFEKDTIAYGTI